MRIEPNIKRTIAFIDGQNLFHNVHNIFNYSYPNYDVVKLSQSVCDSHGWHLININFYTGIPLAQYDPTWHQFWIKKLSALGRHPNVEIYSRPLVYHEKTIDVPDFGQYKFIKGEEKGIDVRLALDALDAAHERRFDVALIFSQDQDLSELATLIRKVAVKQERWIKVASAYPFSPSASNKRGIDYTDWCPINQATYDACIDSRDYR